MSNDHVDVLIVGAGISGIGAGCRLQQRSPGKTFAILEARAAIGGTWDLFRFPGIRSDSDMFTLCYPFRPWSGARAIVDGSAILDYVRETAREQGVDRKIRFHHRVVAAEWSSDDAHWAVEIQRTDTGETVHMTCGFLFSCTGYYRYDEGYTPDFAGIERFGGEVVHPQFWGEDIDYTGKRVVVIGSGATAVTLIPALAQRAQHVTMLQRSPSYIISLPALDPIAGLLARVLPSRLAYPIVRWKNVLIALAIYTFSRRRPATMRRLIRKLTQRRLPRGFDTDTHFTPSYEPWDQRMCVVPDGDLFDAIGDGRVSVVTDRVETFTETGIALGSGAHLDADLVVTATGLRMVPFGAIRLAVDGKDVQLDDALAYRGMQLSGVPNMAFASATRTSRGPSAPTSRASRSAGCSTTWTAAGTRRARHATPIPPSRASRSPISPPATCCARSTSSRGRDRATHGAGTRTTRATGGRCDARRSTTRRSSSRVPLRPPTRRARSPSDGTGGVSSRGTAGG
jgi:monooxygenase